MEDFEPEEVLVAIKGSKGEANRLLYPEAVVSRNIKVRARNAESRKRFDNTDTKRVVKRAIAQMKGQ